MMRYSYLLLEGRPALSRWLTVSSRALILHRSCWFSSRTWVVGVDGALGEELRRDINGAVSCVLGDMREEEDIEDRMYWWPCHGLWVDGGGLELRTWDMDEGERRRVVSKTMGLRVYKSKEAVPRWIRKCFYCLRQCFLNWNAYEKHCHWISRLYWSGSAMRGHKIIGNSGNPGHTVLPDFFQRSAHHQWPSTHYGHLLPKVSSWFLK